MSTLNDDYQRAMAATAPTWHPSFFKEALGGAIGGDRRYKYVPFHALNRQAQARARSLYPNKRTSAKYDFRDEHYLYPVKKDGSLAFANRSLAIPRAQINDDQFMASLGYVKNPGW